MQWSKYNISFLSPRHKCLVLFSLLSETLWTYPPEMVNTIQRMKKNPAAISELPEDVLRAFQNNKFIVDDDRDELSSYINQVLKERYNPFTLRLTIGVTTLCNFKCSYCYENGIHGLSMNHDVENKIMDFVHTFKDINRLYVTWYGGEPLLNWETIERLSSKFISMDIDYEATLITNGFLLSESIINSLKRFSITDLQITMDGMQQIHDKRRMQKNGDGSYDRILGNLESLFRLYPEVHVNLRTNLDRTNISSYPDFYKELKCKFKNNDISLYPGFTCSYFCKNCMDQHDEIKDPKDKAKFYLSMYNDHKIDLGCFLPTRHYTACIANMMNGFLIDPAGDVYKCWSLMGQKEASIGNLNDIDNFSMPMIGRFMASGDFLRDPECLKCQFMPVCNGGCPAARINNSYFRQTEPCCCSAKYRIRDYLEAYLDNEFSGSNHESSGREEGQMRFNENRPRKRCYLER